MTFRLLSYRPRRRGAFTLLELLVVVAIVAVLAGVLAPVLSKITVSSRNVQCQNQLRQIGAAMITHAGDHNGLLPTAGAVVPYRTVDPDTGLPGWTEQLEPYLGTDRKIFVCPSSHILLPNNAQYSYFMACRAAYVENGNRFAPVRLSRIQAASKFFLAGDVVSNTVFSDRAAIDADKSDELSNPGFSPMTKPFHGKKTNLVFADGHVGAFPTFDPYQMTTRYGLKDDGRGYDYSD